jgi:lipooligosaccharide transport system permease protein
VSPSLRVVEYHWLVYRHAWRGGVVETFLAPVFYLLAMGVGLGAFIDRGGAGSAAGVTYLAFLAPGLMAAQAMQTAASESTFPIMAGIVWDKTFLAMLATPLSVRDILVGHLLWVVVRLLMVAFAFFVVMIVFGALLSPTAVLAIPVAVLVGLAFACPITAFAARQRNDSGFNVLFRFVITPLFLFSGTFFPVDRLPPVLRAVAFLTPLYHGVALTRALTLGRIEPLSAAVNVVVLAAFAVVGTALARRALDGRLVS